MALLNWVSIAILVAAFQDLLGGSVPTSQHELREKRQATDYSRCPGQGEYWDVDYSQCYSCGFCTDWEIDNEPGMLVEECRKKNEGCPRGQPYFCRRRRNQPKPKPNTTSKYCIPGIETTSEAPQIMTTTPVVPTQETTSPFTIWPTISTIWPTINGSIPESHHKDIKKTIFIASAVGGGLLVVIAFIIICKLVYFCCYTRGDNPLTLDSDQVVVEYTDETEGINKPVNEECTQLQDSHRTSLLNELEHLNSEDNGPLREELLAICIRKSSSDLFDSRRIISSRKGETFANNFFEVYTSVQSKLNGNISSIFSELIGTSSLDKQLREEFSDHILKFHKCAFCKNHFHKILHKNHNKLKKNNNNLWEPL